MHFLTKVVVSIASLLIFIGDVTLFCLWAPFRIARYIFSVLFHHSRRKNHSTHYSFPLKLKLAYFFFGILFSGLFIFLPLSTFLVIQTLPNPDQLSLNFAPQATKIFDRHGTLLYAIYANQNRTVVPLSDIPTYLQQATIAIEDKTFYKNPAGFDMPSIVRAAISDVSGKGFQGGSTITQQLIKSTLLTPRVSLGRKLQEIILAIWAEKIYTKNQILTMYFNQIPYGGTAWGVEAASQTYFGQHVKDLDLAQSAFLAGLPQAPTTYSPFGESHTIWKKRQEDVLRRMRELGYISNQQEKDADAEALVFVNQQTPLLAPHFVMYIKNLLIEKYGLAVVEKGGLNVTTTLDLSTQNKAQKIVTQEVANDAYLNLTNGAALVTNPKNGDILAMVGSANYNNPKDGNVNLTTAIRQPGSSAKIITYTAAFTKGFTAATILDDSPVSYPLSNGTSYAPVNYDGKFHGRVSLRIAFGNSFNIPAVKTLNAIGVDTFIDLGKKMGLSHLQDASQYGLSATLGAIDTNMIDMATAYGTIANEGKRIDLNPILKITDSKGNILEEKKNPDGTQVVNNGIAFILSNILADNGARMQEFGSNSPLVIPNYTVSVKTGTSDNKRDNWTFGYTPSKLVAVWVGNNDNSPMSQNLASGITGAAPIWHNIMMQLLQGKPDEKMKQPDDVMNKPCIGRNEYFIKGTENSVNCNFVPPITVSPTPNK